MKKFFFFLLSNAISLQAGIYQQAAIDYKVGHKQSHILGIAQSLPMVGVLKAKENGYVYLKVSDEYITKIFPQLILDGHLRPTTSFGSEEGAHITVIKDTEKCTLLEDEINKEFKFEVKEVRYIESWKCSGKFNQYSHHTGDRWVIAVDSAELEELRIRYGLDPLVDGHDFHITIGFEVPFERINNFGERPPSKS